MDAKIQLPQIVTPPPTVLRPRPTPHRPGVSSAMLDRAGVRSITANESRDAIGYAAAGLLLPYRNADGSNLIVNGKPFARLRVTDPGDGAKYLSPAKSGCQAYIPPGLDKLLGTGSDLVIVEGEFKALSLVEAGVAAVGIGGITSACPKGQDGLPELLPAIRRIIDEHRPTRLLFLGDGDTCFIEAFSREAVKLAKVAGVPVVLPRIQIDAPGKGPDDLREALGPDGFRALWWKTVAEAEPVTAGTDPAALARRLLRREKDALTRLSGDTRDDAEERLVKLAARTNDAGLSAEVEEVFDHIGIPRKVARAKIKAAREKEEAAREAEHLDRVAKRTAADGEEPLFFDGSNYFRRENDGCFGKLTRPDALLHFHALGLRRTGDPLSPAEAALNTVQRSNRIYYAGPLCGRDVGLVEENGSRILVTRPPRYITGTAGESPTIDTVIASIFGVTSGDPHAVAQVSIFVGWLKHAREAMRHPDRHTPGIVLAIVGPPDCGKGLVQDFIITPGIGGRCADPAAWLMGATSFNSDLWGAEHLALSDKSLDGNGTQRERLRNNLKELVANSHHYLHPKGREACTMRPLWRVSITANIDPDSASVLPTLEGGFADKIAYLRAYSPPTPFFNEHTPGEREAFASRLRAELPHFLDAVDSCATPAEFVGGRWGVKAWHHPEVIALLETSNALAPLIEVLDTWMNGWPAGTVREIQTGELFTQLDNLTDGNLSRRKIASGVSHLGHQLARLAVKPEWRGLIEPAPSREGPREINRPKAGWRFTKGAA
jgi:hypothetical protein